MTKWKSKKFLIVITISVIIFTGTGVVAATSVPATGVSYTNSATSETTVQGALDELFDKVDIEEKIGNTSIAGIGDETITGSISTINTQITSTTNNLKWTEVGGSNTTGTWEHWMYRPVGYLMYEVYGQIEYENFAMTTAYGTMYFKNITVTLPFTIASISDYNVTVFGATGLINANMHHYSTNSASFYVWDSKSETKTITLNLYLLVKV